MTLVSVKFPQLQLAPKLHLLARELGLSLFLMGFTGDRLRGLPPLRSRNVNEFPLNAKARFARAALPCRRALPWNAIRHG